MKKCVVLGHFGFGHDKTNGQTIKTKTIGDELRRVFGGDEVSFEDTMGGWRFLLRLPAVVLRMLRHHQNVVFLPAYKGVRVIVPMLVLLNFFFHRCLHYVVIGGWLPDYVRRYPLLRSALRRVDHIFVETHYMKKALEAAGMTNILVMPNCKKLKTVELKENDEREQRPFRLCTFSRVMQTKGIGEAVEAVARLNSEQRSIVFELDIYGPVEDEAWFNELMKPQHKGIRYCGTVPFDKSTETLQHYFALLFPTSYPGEGFAGTIIDAMAAGLPTIASDWHSNSELIDEGTTGMLFPTGDAIALSTILSDIAVHPEKVSAMRPHCIAKAEEYQPGHVVKLLTSKMK